MMKYGAEPIEHLFALRCIEIERRGQWLDILLSLQLAEGETLPPGLESPSVLVICSPSGEIIQIILHDEGCDSEFQFTYTEKAQIELFVAEYCRPLLPITREN